MMNINIGDVVISAAGRDKGRTFIVVGVENEQYCYICDGKMRRAAAPKLKKVRHLKMICNCNGEISALLRSDRALTNKSVRKVLADVKAKNGEE